MAAAVLFYVFLRRAYTAGTPTLCAATVAALGLYLLLRWRLPAAVRARP